MKIEIGKIEEPIEWTVVEEDEKRVIAIAEKGIIVRPFDDVMNKGIKKIFWENSDLNQYLNNDFLKNFSDLEKQKIIEISIPSIADIERWMPKRSDKVCQPTDYAIRRGASKYGYDGEGCVYWLSDTGRRKGLSATVILANGVIYQSAYMYAENVCVRPMIIIRKEIRKWE